MLTRIGGSESPPAADPGAGDANAFATAAAALGRALGVPAERQGAFKAGLRAVVFALYREYEDEMPMPKSKKPDPGY